MIRYGFTGKRKSALRIMFLGAHCDDIEIGCGGTILKLIKEYDHAVFHWIVFSSDPSRADEARASADLFLKGAKEKTIVIKDFRNGYFPYVGGEIKDYFEHLKTAVEPDIIFTHYRDDRHQDHRLISDLTWNTYRNHHILEYEIVKYDGDMSSPNFYVGLDSGTCHKKIKYIIDSFRSQRDKNWFAEDAFLSIMRIRGIESNAPGKFAEGYFCRKILF